MPTQAEIDFFTQNGTLTPHHIIGGVEGRKVDIPEIFTFGYVGSSGGSSTYALRYYSDNSQFASGAEVTVQQTIPFTVRVKRVIMKQGTNSLNTNATASLRDDEEDVLGTVMTMIPGNIDEIDTGPLDVEILKGSKINWKIDISAASTGSWQINSMIAYMMTASYL